MSLHMEFFLKASLSISSDRIVFLNGALDKKQAYMAYKLRLIDSLFECLFDSLFDCLFDSLFGSLCDSLFDGLFWSRF